MSDRRNEIVSQRDTRAVARDRRATARPNLDRRRTAVGLRPGGAAAAQHQHDRNHCGGPISWGICEVPGWGTQLSVDRVLSEMRDVGLRATELGAAGWLPDDPTKVREILGRYGLQAVAAFIPLVLHDPAQRAAT